MISVREVNESVHDETRGYIGHSSPTSDEVDQASFSENVEGNFSYLHCLYVLVVLLICVVFTSTQTLIPWNDTFEFPEYWWENMVRMGLIYMALRNITMTIWEVWLVFKHKEVLTFRWFMRFFAIVSFPFNILYWLIYLYWTKYSGNNHPMPLWLLLVGYPADACKFITIWFSVSKELRKDQKVRKRLKYYILYLFAWNLILIMEFFMDFMLVTLTTLDKESGYPVQSLMAFIIPLCRGVFEWILPKPFHKALGYKKDWTKLDEDVPATFAMETQIADIFTLYVAIRMGSAEQLTVICILGVEFCINLFHCFRIIQLHKKIGDTDDQQNKIWKAEKESAVTSLITVEVIEVLVPFAYAMGYLTAYYGPNAELMTGVKSTYFGQTPVTDIQSLLNFLFFMCGVDTLGAIVIAILLGYFCKINFVKEFCKIMQKHWITLAIYLGTDVMHVS